MNNFVHSYTLLTYTFKLPLHPRVSLNLSDRRIKKVDRLEPSKPRDSPCPSPLDTKFHHTTCLTVNLFRTRPSLHGHPRRRRRRRKESGHPSNKSSYNTILSHFHNFP